ncbi:MFS transporter [Streptomyces sp. bgisy091]|uniref:MFS transporter n=1 Tax=Streptomyces sp. bgisy091 TaxID=3413778 RepID=UPI003D706468
MLTEVGGPRAVEDRVLIRKVVTGTTLGQVVEWFDWAVYGTFAPYFAAQFFPSDSPTASLLSTFAVFAVSFVARPLGGVLFGRLADRLGRRPAFTFALLLMAAGMALIMVTPGYATIGWVAPVLLVVARIMQGLSAGGEMPASTAFLTELVGAGRRGFHASFLFVGIGVGTLLATTSGAVLTGVLSDEQLTSWGWRLPFALGVVVALLGWWLRRNLPETPVYEARREQLTARASSGERSGILRGQLRPILTVLFISSGGTVAFYTFSVSAPARLNGSLGLDPGQVFTALSVALLLYTVQMPLWGWLSDRWGRRPLIITGALGTALVGVPLVAGLRGEFAGDTVRLCVAVSLLAMFTATGSAVMAELFPARARAQGIGLTYAIATAVFGGTAPYLGTWLDDKGVPLVFSVWVGLLCAATALTAYLMPETARKELR